MKNTGSTADPLNAAMNVFQSALQQVRSLIEDTPVLSDQDRAEGYQYLAGLLAWVLERATANADPNAPYFMRWFDGFTKFGLENPDNLYVSAEISDQGDYMVSGTRGSAADIVWQVLDTDPGDGSLGKLIDSIDLDRLEFDEDGSYQIVISNQPHKGNWLKTEPGAKIVLGRQCFSDWATQVRGDMDISRPGFEGKATIPLTIEAMAARIEKAAQLLVNQVRYWQQYIGPWCEQPANTLCEPKLTVGGVGKQVISTGWCQLADDEAMLVSFPPCPARYQGFQLGHRWWFHTFDYRCRQSSLNGAQARLSSDGMYHYAISASDPGVPNWLDTAGHSEALISIRWQGLSEQIPVPPTTEIVKLANLRQYFPAEEPVVSGTQRREQIAIRQKSVDRRFSS
jgi:Protein of unknown function (DUF1214)